MTIGFCCTRRSTRFSDGASEVVLLQFGEDAQARFRFGCPVTHGAFEFVVEMLREFLDDLGFAFRRELEGRQPLPDFVLELRHVESR